MMDGVGSVGRGLVFHGNASGNRTVGTFHVGKHFRQDGIVKDRSVEQLFLHGLCQVFIRLGIPFVVLEELVECRVISCKHSL